MVKESGKYLRFKGLGKEALLFSCLSFLLAHISVVLFSYYCVGSVGCKNRVRVFTAGTAVEGLLCWVRGREGSVGV